MKLHILSDLHLEFALFDPPETNADVVLLAGDISMWGKEDLAGYKKPLAARRLFMLRETMNITGKHYRSSQKNWNNYQSIQGFIFWKMRVSPSEM